MHLAVVPETVSVELHEEVYKLHIDISCANTVPLKQTTATTVITIAAIIFFAIKSTPFQGETALSLIFMQSPYVRLYHSTDTLSKFTE